MGCRALTPDLVGLARRLEGRPFHLVATHCQRAPRESVVAYLKAAGVEPDSPNFTLTSFGGHPEVKGNGYVPYYMVFDHHGKLVRHHMGGAYHGGDGLEVVEWVDRLLEDAPAIYLGEEPFTKIPDLADRVATGRGLGTTVRELEERIDAGAEEPAAGPARAEMLRLLAIVRKHRDERVGRALRLLATTPGKIVPRLKSVEKDLRGSRLGEEVAERIDVLERSDELKEAMKVEKAFLRYTESLERARPCRACRRRGSKTIDLACSGCRSANRTAISRAVDRLTELLEDHEGLAILSRVRAYLRKLRGAE